MYMWAALQTHRVLQGYIELDFISHLEVISVVVEHLIQTRVPIAMREDMKAEMSGLKASVKAATNLVEKWNLRWGAKGRTSLNFSKRSRLLKSD
jgi:hypothetical protein